MRTILVTALAALLAPAGAAAHEVTHEVVYGRAVAVRARYAGHAPLANAEYQVFRPGDPRVPWQKGRTDREGWLSFVPNQAGTWRVQVADRSGHGLILSVPAEPPAAAPAASPPAAESAAESAEGGVPWLVRLAGAVAAVGAVFAALAVFHRRRRPTS